MQRHLVLPLVLLHSASACSDTWCLDAGCCRSRAVCAIPYIAQPSYRRRRSVSYFDCENSYTCCPPCSQYTCPAGYWLKDDAEWIGGYNVDECCNGPLCSIYKCPAGYILRPDANATPGDTDGICCQATSTTSTTSRTGTTLTSTTVSSTTRTTTTTTRLMLPGQSSAAAEAAAAASAVKNAIKEGAKTLILGALANSSSAAMETPVGKLTVFSLDKLAADGKAPSVPVEGGSKLTVPTGLMKSLPKGAVLSTLAIKKQKKEGETDDGTGNGNIARKVEDDPFYNLRGDNGEKLSAPTMDISMFSSSADQLELGTMAEPLLFKLPETRGDAEGEPQCVYLETEGGTVRWSTKGVRRATMEEVQAAGEAPFGVWCKTEHFSIFTAILLGCMNFELLSPAALEAVTSNEQWPSYQPSILIFCIAGLLLGVQAYGVMRERFFLRWGWHLPDPRATATSAPKIGIKELLANRCAKLERQTMIAGVQRSLAVRTGIATGCISKHCWNGHGWIDSQTPIPRTVQFHKLEFYSGLVESVVNSDLRGTRPTSALWRFYAAWKAMHPMLDALRAGTTTVMKRISLFSTTIFGVLASNAMIFQFSGGVRSWEAAEACPVEPTSQLFTLVAVLASIMLNVIPNTILKVIAKPAGKKVICNVFFWFLTSLYLIFACLIVISALANMNSQDQGVWYAAVQWAMGIKIVVVPTAKAMKDSLLLEFFLLKDKSKCTKFLVDVKLKNAKERSLEGKARETVERIARQAISAEELVHFYSMLGNKVMLGYDPETSTSEDVINGAIKLLSIKPPTTQELPLHIEVVEARLPAASLDGPMSCSVLHLGKKARFQRICIEEHRSSATVAAIDNSTARCSWGFTASVVGLELDHALGFRVTTQKGKILGIACLTLEEILQGRGFSGELLLHPPGAHGAKSAGHGQGGGDPDPASGRLPLPVELFTVPSNARAGPPVQPPRVSVKVDMPRGYLEALALLELKKLKGWQQEVHAGNGNGNGSSANGNGPGNAARDRAGLRADLLATVAERANNEGWTPALAGGAFCKVCNYKGGELPPDRLVVHCRKGNFLHFVTAVLTDALGDDNDYPRIRRRLVDGDFAGLLQMLKAQKTENVRYWIDMFAMDLLSGHQDLTLKDASHWHEQLMAALPSIIRCLKRDCCAQMVADIKANTQARCTFPTQLLIMDRNFWLMREHSCLAEAMLAKSMGVKQRILFHPDHMHGQGLKDSLDRVAEELKTVKGNSAEMPWTLQYLEDRQETFNTLESLVTQGIKEKKDGDSILEDLNLSDIGATIIAHQASVGAAEMVAAHALDVGAQQLENLQV